MNMSESDRVVAATTIFGDDDEDVAQISLFDDSEDEPGEDGVNAQGK
jgi:hypothetical protein